MAIDTTNINTGGAVVTIGGVIPAATNPDGDGFYWGTVSGTDIGCTTGGVTVSYTFEKQDIFCDQTLAAVESSIISEAAEISLNMLETDAANLQLAIQQAVRTTNAGTDDKVGVGGVTTITYVPLKLEITDNDTAKLITWTFFRVLSNGIEINFERENPTQINVTFTAYADASHAVGHQLFSVHYDLTT
jgi:hypothetical protein